MLIAQADSLKKIAQEKEKLEIEKKARQLALVKEESEKRKKEDEAQKAIEEEQMIAKVAEEKRLADERNKEEEAAKAQAELDAKVKLERDIEIRKAKALAEKLNEQNELYKNAAQKAAEELSEVKKDYPRGKTVEEFERFGMKITRTIVIDSEVVRIYLKVIHEWGATYYFKNNQAISHYLYTVELKRV